MYKRQAQGRRLLDRCGTGDEKSRRNLFGFPHEDIKQFLTEGQEVKVKLIAIDEQGRINLSIKKALPEKRPERPQRPRQAVPAPVRSTLQKTGDLSFEDKLKHFMQASESRISDSRAFGEKRSSRRRGR